LGHRPSDVLLTEQVPIYIGTRPDVSSVEKALRALDRTKHEGNHASSVEIFSLGASGDAADTAKICAAWAIILASQQRGGATDLSMFVPGPGEFRELNLYQLIWGDPS
jgi:hypothetical protein